MEIIELAEETVDRSRSLMEKYSDTPMSLADASLVAVAERLGLKRIFTLDSDFDVYRFRGRQRFERIPTDVTSRQQGKPARRRSGLNSIHLGPTPGHHLARQSWSRSSGPTQL